MSRVPVIWLLLGGDRSVRNSAYRGEAAPLPVISLALQQALQSWDGFLDRLPIGIYACDRGGIVVQYNRRAAELWGPLARRGPAALLRQLQDLSRRWRAAAPVR